MIGEVFTSASNTEILDVSHFFQAYYLEFFIEVWGKMFFIFLQILLEKRKEFLWLNTPELFTSF